MERLKRNQYLPILIHLIVWAFLFIFPLLTRDNISERGLLHKHWIPLVLSMLIFYTNFLLLIPRFYQQREYWWYVLINLVLISLCVYISMSLMKIYHQDISHHPRMHEHVRRIGKIFWYRNLISFFLAIGSAIALKMTARVQEEQRIRKEAETERLKSEISSLKYQVQPHFFFNTLNSIYSLIDLDKERAKEVLHRLSKLMRYVLYIGNETLVDLSKELEFLKSYSELMRTRFDEKLELEINFPETVAGKVPPLLFISLLENAFKHGIDPVSTSHITASAELKDHKIHFVLVNSYYPKSNIDESGSGIGVQNLKKRLAYLFEAESYILTHELRGDKYYSELIIPVE